MSNKYSESFQFLLLTFICSLALIWVLRLWQFDIHTPIFYAEGDNFYSSMAVKTVVETGWFHFNPALGAPFGSQLYDFFQPYGLNYLIINLLAPFSSGDWVVTLNLFVLSSYYFACWAAWFLFRKLELAPLYAGAAAILFAFTPYHLIRGLGGHLFLSSIFIVPLAIWLALQINEEKRCFSSLRRSWREVVVAILLGNCGIYYAFFGCFAFLLSGVIGSIQHSTRRSISAALIAISLTISSIMISTAPVLVEHLKHGSNTQISQRSAADSEHHGLKLIQLVLPVEGHRLPLFQEITTDYQRESPLVAENKIAALGIVAAFGFVLLLLFFIARKPMRKLGGKIDLLAHLNIGFFLLGTIGGIGTVFAWLISPMLRAYNRVSIFIACLALAAAFLFLQWLMRSMQETLPGQKISLIIVSSILVLGLLDQTTPSMAPDHDAIQRRFQIHDKFIDAVEKHLPPGALIFQTPHTTFPEARPHHQEGPYAQAIGYLHSKNIHWSYGAIKGRQSNDWSSAVDQLPARERIKYLAATGFSGIYIERRGFSDHALALEKEIGAILGISAIESESKHQAFYPIQAAPDKQLPGIVTYRLENGFWQWEGAPGRHIWSKGNAELSIEVVNFQQDTRINQVAFSIYSLNKRQVTIFVNDELHNTFELSPSQVQSVSLEPTIPKSRLQLRFETDVNPVHPSDIGPNSKDARGLAFALDNFSIGQNSEPVNSDPLERQAEP